MNPVQIALDAIASLPRGASFNRGKSKQDYRTPDDFRGAVIHKFGMPQFDLAASATNFFSPSDSEYFGAGIDSLTQDWHDLLGPCWLNPPFGEITPWARKCAWESKLGAKILFLIPASVGSNWWAEYVHNIAFVHFVRPRICFDGKNPFPKDIALCEYGTPRVGYDLLKWK